MGLFARSRAGSLAGGMNPDPSFSPTTPGSSPPLTIIDKKRANEVRRRGRQPKIRGMVGLQRPEVNFLLDIYVTCLFIFCKSAVCLDSEVSCLFTF